MDSFVEENIRANVQDASFAIQEQGRPCFLLKPRLFPDGNKWCALYGSNLQEGLAGFGDTPRQAMYDFDKNFDSYTLVAPNEQAAPAEQKGGQ